jgi:hypothetical protein
MVVRQSNQDSWRDVLPCEDDSQDQNVFGLADATYVPSETLAGE